jgi:predicted enzyme involved in methoxymalonyl-ACP biosynthesis
VKISLISVISVPIKEKDGTQITRIMQMGADKKNSENQFNLHCQRSNKRKEWHADDTDLADGRR